MKDYRRPVLRRLGRISDLTLGNNNNGNDNATFEIPPSQ